MLARQKTSAAKSPAASSLRRARRRKSSCTSAVVSAREVDRGEKDKQREGEQPDHDRERGRPSGDKTRGDLPVNDPDVAGRHAAQRRPEENGRHRGRPREHAAPARAHVVRLEAVGAKGKGGSSEDDTDQRCRKGDVKGGAYRRKRAGKDREHQNDDEDQPDVIGLPDRRDGVFDGFALRLLSGPGCQKVPDAAAEVRAAGQHVRDEARAHDVPVQFRRRHAGTSAVGRSRGGVWPPCAMGT